MILFDDDETDDDNPDLPVIVRQALQHSDLYTTEQFVHNTELRWRYFENKPYERSWINRPSDRRLGPNRIQIMKRLYKNMRPLMEACNTAATVDRDRVYANAQLAPKLPNEKLQDRLKQKWVYGEAHLEARRATLTGAVTGGHYYLATPSWMRPEGSSISAIQSFSPDVMHLFYDPLDHRTVLAAKIEYIYFERESEISQNIERLAGQARHIAPQYSLLDYIESPMGDADMHIYTMVITPEAYYTFRDHSLYDFDMDTPGFSGAPQNSWENPLGAVPAVYVPFLDMSGGPGSPTFEAALEPLDAINDLISRFGNIVKIHADPVLMLFGVSPDDEIVKEVRDDGTTVWYIPNPSTMGVLTNAPQAKAEYLEIKGSNVPALYEYVEKIASDARDILPELALKHQADLDAQSGYDTSIKLLRLQSKLSTVREYEFAGLETITQIALVQDDIKQRVVRDGPALLLRAKEKYDVQVIADPVLPHDIATLVSAHATMMGNGAMSKLEALVRQGYTEAQAEEILARVEKEKRDAAKVDMEIAEMQAEAQMAQQAKAISMGVALPAGMTAAGANGSKNGTAAPKGSTPQPSTRPSPAGGSTTLSNPRVRAQPRNKGDDRNRTRR